MKVGDLVSWTSQSAGTVKTKMGVIVAVVPVDEEPEDVIRQELLEKQYVVPRFFGQSRSHVSYLVAVGHKIYWPRVSQLAAERR